MVNRSRSQGSNPDPFAHKVLARWAADCAERALMIFENARPDDTRPRAAIDTLRAWINDEVPMTACRSAAFAAHAAARGAEQAGARAAVAAARAAGQAAAVAHTASHTRHAATYAARAVGLHTSDSQCHLAERNWQWSNLAPEMRSIAYPDRSRTHVATPADQQSPT